MVRAFWQVGEVQRAVDSMASHDNLTMVIGAGASVEVGFPMWGTLVQRVLKSAVEATFPALTDGQRETLVQEFTSDGYLAAASYAQVLLGDRLPTAMNKALYADVRAPRVPGSVSTAVAALFQSLGPDAELATTNYDEQLVRAFMAAEVSGAKAVRSGRKRNSSEPLIRHLHGQTSYTGAADEVVLTEEDYFRPARRSWQAKFMEERLSGGSALFVGMSLSDPNLLRYLHTQTAKPTPGKHIAIFTLPASGGDALSDARRETLKRKWRSVGVQALYNDFYGQTTQFLYEILQKRILGSAYEEYQNRLDLWATDMESWLFDESSDSSFARNQEVVQAALLEAREVILALAQEADIHLAVGERISLDLWARRPRQREMVEIGSAARRYASMSDLPRLLIAPGEGHQVVTTFGRDARTMRSLPFVNSPWKSMMALPVALPAGTLGYGRLPVGVVTVTSNRPMGECVLDKIADRLPAVDDYLASSDGLAQKLLDPRGGSVA